MMKTATGAARRVSGCSPPPCLKPTRGCPWREDGRLHDPVLRENFIERVFALHELNTLRAKGLTRRALLDFHSRYKLQLLAHHQAGYREIGRSLRRCMNRRDLDAFFVAYREKLMTILKSPPRGKTIPTC